MAGEIFGRYQLIGLLGRGGMGEVYRAHDTATERIVALKLLPAEFAADPQFERRFRREARTAAGLNDPHVVPIHNYGEIDGRLYVDMRLIEGRDLATVIADDGGHLSAARAVGIVEQVASALDTAHRADLVHRDIKPSNILVTERDFAYLIDFGIARATTDTAMTGTGHMVGTLAYMAPERFNGIADPASDVYALACVLHECLTGLRPYPGDSFEQQVAGHLTSPPPHPSATVPDLPQALDAVIAKGMAKNPDDRYQTASELAGAARAALTSPPRAAAWIPPQAPTQAAPLPGGWAAGTAMTGSPSHAGRRILLIAGGAVAAAIAIVAAVAIAVVSHHHENKNASTEASTALTSTVGSASTAATPLAGQLPPFQPSTSVGANCQYPATPDEPASKPVKPPRTGKVPTDPASVSVSMKTSQGNIGLLLANNESPCTVNNFASLASQGFFNNTKCHRLTTEPELSILQCGDPTGEGAGGPGYGFANEYPTDQFPPNDPKLQQAVTYPRGTIAMAHSKQPDSNGSQFFLVYKDSQLPPDYTVFGTIQPDGLTTLDKIAAAGVAGGQPEGQPKADVTITSVLLD